MAVLLKRPRPQVARTPLARDAQHRSRILLSLDLQDAGEPARIGEPHPGHRLQRAIQAGVGPPRPAGQAIEAVRTARRQGATVSCDLNFRKKLWRYGKPAPEVMRELMDYVDITVGNEEDVQKSLEIETDVDVESGSIDIERFKSLTGDVLNQFDSLKKIAVTIRTSLSADVNLWQAVLNNRHEFIVSREYEIRDIVDRVGSGDAFCAGLIYGLSILEDDRKALEFATASGCLKHSVHGDFPLATVDEVMSLVRGSGSGRIQR